MLSPLLGISGVNSLLFASYGISKRIISPFPNLSLGEIALAGAMAGAANAILASPGVSSVLSGCGYCQYHIEVFGLVVSALRLHSCLTNDASCSRSRDVQSADARPIRCRDR
jgi:hypothetical protein